jgi:hydantoinase/carbamoylase family amidase
MSDADVAAEVSLDRIQRRLDAIWEIGRTDDGGVTRLAYSDEETAAIEYVLGELDDRFTVRTDSIGNVFADTDPDADRAVYLGSHLDSVFNGGRLDGALGVVMALEAIEVALAVGDPPVSPTLAILRAEESTRFGQWAIGSRGALGQLTVEDFSATDQSSVPLWQAMQDQNLRPRDLDRPTIDLDRVACFFETHIEQGRVLDEHDEHVGVVTSIRAPVRYRVTVEGDSDHSGATPMGMRRDAIAGAAEMITTVERVGDTAAESGDLVATVGDVTADGGAINKVCGRVTFPIDVRSTDRSHRDGVEATLLDRLEGVADRRDLDVDLSLVDRSDPVELDSATTGTLASVADDLAVPYRRLPSGGGHDAMNFQHRGIPTGMLFVPSIDGISHNPNEATPDDAIRDAMRVLTHALLGDPTAGESPIAEPESND